MRSAIATIVIGVMTWTATGPGQATVPVGREFAVVHEVQPEVTAVDAEGNVLESRVPEGPYAWEYKYDRTLIAFARADAGIVTTYREIANTPYAVVRCESSASSGAVYFTALKVTASPVKLPVQNATANGVAIPVSNEDTLAITAESARLRIRLQGPVTITVGE